MRKRIIMFDNDLIYWVFILSMMWTSAFSTAPGIVTINIGFSELIESSSSDEYQYNLEFCVGSGRVSEEQCALLPIQKISGQYVPGQTFSVKRSFEVDDIRSSFYFNGLFSFKTPNEPLKTIRYKDNLFQYTTHSHTQTQSLQSVNFESLSMEISVKCKDGYYPSFQCIRSCYSIPGINDCDINGTKICFPGYSLLASLGECIKDECKLNIGICKNNSTCQNSLSSIKCICQPNYSGTECEIWEPCTNHKCQNSGTCVPRRHPLDYVCQCKENYYGKNCEHYDDPCKQKKCPTGTICQASNLEASCVEAPKYESRNSNRRMFSKNSRQSTTGRTNKLDSLVIGVGQTTGRETVQLIQYPVQKDFTTIGIIIILLFFMICCFTIIFWIQMNKYIQRRNKSNYHHDIFHTPSVIPIRSHERYEDSIKRWRSMDDGFANTWHQKTCSQFSVISFKSGFNTCERPERISYGIWPTAVKSTVTTKNEGTDTTLLATNAYLHETTQTDTDKVYESDQEIDDKDLPMPEPAV